MRLLCTVTAVLVLGAALAAQTDAEVVKAQLPSYPLETCVVSDEPLGAMGPAMNVVHEGRLVRFCCGGCTKSFNEEPASYIAKIDAAVVHAQKASYPLERCAVSGEPLEEDAIDAVVGTRLVRLCCKGCQRDLTADPATFLAKVDAALIAAQVPTYPLTACVVSDEPFEADGALDRLHGTQLVRFCCKMCVRDFERAPAKFLEKIAAARGSEDADGES